MTVFIYCSNLQQDERVKEQFFGTIGTLIGAYKLGRQLYDTFRGEPRVDVQENSKRGIQDTALLYNTLQNLMQGMMKDKQSATELQVSL